MKRILALLLMLSAALPLARAAEEELLEPDKAFALSTRALDGQTIEVSWKIAPGYYMYRDKLRVESLDSKLALKSPQLPDGKRKQDPLFGNTEVYFKQVVMRVPIERANSGAATARLRITGQGCNEPVGVCYPPITKEVSVALPALKLASANATGEGVRSLKDLARSLSSGSSAAEEPIDPDKAFVLSVSAAGSDAVNVHIDILDCCYLYRDKLKVELAAAPGAKLAQGVRLGDIQLPAGKRKKDEFLGDTEVYQKPIDVRVPVANLGKANGAVLKIGYQGCSEKGAAICYPPMTKTFALGGLASAAAADVVPPAAATTPQQQTETTKVGVGRFLAYMAGAFGVGLLLTFTPCVLPMIPILSSVLVSSTSDRRLTKFEGGAMSSAYVLGTAATYTLAGVVAGATGEQLQAYFQNPWMLATFAGLFVLLSLSMFGFYELQMPSFIQSHLHHHSHHMHGRLKHIKGGAFVGLFGMGMLSALIVGACVSPLLISALSVAIVNRDPILGGAIMFSMALGMGVILIAIGVGAGFLLPKAGAWMDRVKHVFGVLLLGVAIYMLGLIPAVPVLLLWAVLLIVVGIYLGATQSLPPEASGWQYLWKGIGTVALIWGIAAMLGGFSGNREILQPLPLGSMLTGGATAGTVAPAKHFERVRNTAELDTQLTRAKAAGKLVMLDYYADWCTDCVRMEKTTFADARVREEFARRFVLLQADVTDNSDPDVKALKNRFGVFGPPALLFFDTQGGERRDLRTYGYRNAEDFLALLRKL